MGLTFRMAEKKDAGLILQLIRELASYENMPDAVSTTEETLVEGLFRQKRAEVLFVLADGKEIGYVLYFFNFPSFFGTAGMYMEDIFIKPEYRGMGYGKAILRQLTQIALAHDCCKMEWQCLNWNQPSINFYLSMGAKPSKEWTVYRLDRQAMTALAQTE